MQRVMIILTRGPTFLSSTVRLISWKRERSEPYTMDWSCRSHSPPWSQMGQSRGWLLRRYSMTPSLAFFTIGVSVHTFIPGMTGTAQDAMGLGLFSTSTRHMRQLPATDRRSW
jgi:hypothetical protein